MPKRYMRIVQSDNKYLGFGHKAYSEHGGCYVSRRLLTAVPPGDGTISNLASTSPALGCAYRRFWSLPFIGAGTVYRATQGRIDHAEGTERQGSRGGPRRTAPSPLKAAARINLVGRPHPWQLRPRAAVLCLLHDAFQSAN